MEQCVARLDVAMFNAILRESDDEIPTDPVSDAISDPKVLPIPPGNSTFGGGAQLKTVVYFFEVQIMNVLFRCPVQFLKHDLKNHSFSYLVHNVLSNPSC
jgi:hypothetical protein